MILLYIILSLIPSIIWGVVVYKVIENKGYYENWFWWGFFFGIFALIVALTKPTVQYTAEQHEEETKIKKILEEKEKERTIQNGGWECIKCGKVLPHYTGTCGCGNTKSNNEMLEEKKRVQEEKKAEEQRKTDEAASKSNNKSVDAVEEIKRYKELLDSGVITETEFEAKKKQLLGI